MIFDTVIPHIFVCHIYWIWKSKWWEYLDIVDILIGLNSGKLLVKYGMEMQGPRQGDSHSSKMGLQKGRPTSSSNSVPRLEKWCVLLTICISDTSIAKSSAGKHISSKGMK